MPTLTIHVEPVPLRTDEHGTVRVGDSRVTLDVVIHEWNKGTSAEGIAHAYSTLSLADVYAVIGYYLHHQEEVDAYLLAREEQAENLRQEIEARQPDRSNLRAKLLARRAQAE
jgi:uncharacterized protein (DUF433 family)